MLTAGCSLNNTGSDASAVSGEAEQVSVTSNAVNESGMFSDRDLEVGYSEADAVKIALNGASATSSDKSNVDISGGTVTVSDEGVYVLSGDLSDGQIVVDAEKTDKIQLVLNGASITSSDSAAIYIKSADKVFITLTDTENSLTSSGEFKTTDDNNVDAAIFSKEDLTLNGVGSLKTVSACGHGIVSKDDLVITGGTIDITSAGHGLSGKDSVRVAGGNITVKSDKDGVHSENADDESKGFIYIENGTFDITAKKDGIDASGYLTVNGGKFNIVSSVDAIHSNADVTITAGTFEISADDDGIHADSAVAISGGTASITKSYEGIEGQNITLSGGKITIKASDDGLNAAGGNDSSGANGRMGQDKFKADENCFIEIKGGTLNINASGDGIDSNGSIKVSGGTTYVSGPSNNGNGAIDCGEGLSPVITGGTVIAAASSGMAVTFGGESTQCSIMYNMTSAKDGGTAVTLKDGSGKVLASFTPENKYQSVVISVPAMKQNEKYTVTAGDESKEITQSSVSVTEGEAGGMSGFMKDGFRGDKGGMTLPTDENGETLKKFDGERPEMPRGEMPEMPEMPNGGKAADNSGGASV